MRGLPPERCEELATIVEMVNRWEGRIVQVVNDCASSRTIYDLVNMWNVIVDAILQYGVRGVGVAFLQKPFRLDALAGKVREMLGSRATDGDDRESTDC